MDVKLFNTQSITKLKAGELSCNCSKMHICRTGDVYFEAGAIKKTGEALKNIIPPLSCVGIICDEAAFEIAVRAAEKSLVREGYRTKIIRLEENETPTVARCSDIVFAENIRAIVAIGGGGIVEIAKFKAQLLNVPLAVVVLSPDCISYLCPSAVLFDGGIEQIFRANPPSAVIADIDLLAIAPSVQSASAFGALASKLTALFDWRFAHALNREVFCQHIYEQGFAIVDEAIEMLSRPAKVKSRTNALLAELNLKFSVLTQLCANTRLLCGGESQCAHTLSILFSHEQRVQKFRGENEFLFARVVVNLYKNILSKKGQFFVPPPDNNMRLEKLKEFFGLDESVAINRMRPVQKPSTLELAAYKLEEYRAELYYSLAMCENRLKTAWRIFKRLYDDDGYSLTNYIDEADVSLCISLAPDLKEKYTMLTFMKNAGYLDAYLIDLIV